MSSVLKLIRKNAAEKNVQGIPNIKLNAPLKTRLYKDSLGIEIELEGANLPNEGYLDGIVAPSSGVRWTPLS